MQPAGILQPQPQLMDLIKKRFLVQIMRQDDELIAADTVTRIWREAGAQMIQHSLSAPDLRSRDPKLVIDFLESVEIDKQNSGGFRTLHLLIQILNIAVAVEQSG